MLEIMFFYILSTVFDVCPIYLEEYWNNQTTLEMYVCFQKEICVLLAQIHPH